jgi:polyhydroxybutyrate depolymerase
MQSKALLWIAILFIFLLVLSVCAFAGWKDKIGLAGKDVRVPVQWLGASGGPGVASGPGEYGRKISFGGLTRFYLIHVPPSYDKTKPVPVVLVFHGGGGYPDAIRYDSGMDRVSNREGFIVVYPGGAPGSKLFEDRLLIWNDGRPFKGRQSGVDDVGFVQALLNDLANFFTIDPKRVYAAGISNGAQFCYRLAQQLSNRIAAIAAVGGQRAVNDYFSPPPRPISIMQFSGLKDVYAPYYGGKSVERINKFETNLKPVEAAVQSWATFDGCSSKPSEVKRIGQAVKTQWGPCKNNTEVVLWTLENGGHTWPGGRAMPSETRGVFGAPGVGPINQDISASNEMWQFFKRQTVP